MHRNEIGITQKDTGYYIFDIKWGMKKKTGCETHWAPVSTEFSADEINHIKRFETLKKKNLFAKIFTATTFEGGKYVKTFYLYL